MFTWYHYLLLQSIILLHTILCPLEMHISQQLSCLQIDQLRYLNVKNEVLVGPSTLCAFKYQTKEQNIGDYQADLN